MTQPDEASLGKEGYEKMSGGEPFVSALAGPVMVMVFVGVFQWEKRMGGQGSV